MATGEAARWSAPKRLNATTGWPSTTYSARPLFQSPSAHTTPAHPPDPSAAGTSRCAVSSKPPASGGIRSSAAPPPARAAGWGGGGELRGPPPPPAQRRHQVLGDAAAARPEDAPVARRVGGRLHRDRSTDEAVVERQHLVAAGLVPPQRLELAHDLRMLVGHVDCLGEVGGQVEQRPPVRGEVMAAG